MSWVVRMAIRARPTTAPAASRRAPTPACTAASPARSPYAADNTHTNAIVACVLLNAEFCLNDASKRWVGPLVPRYPRRILPAATRSPRSRRDPASSHRGVADLLPLDRVFSGGCVGIGRDGLPERMRGRACMQEEQTPDRELLGRIRGEYSEMPGLSLTLAQAQRLWLLECSTCEALLERRANITNTCPERTNTRQSQRHGCQKRRTRSQNSRMSQRTPTGPSISPNQRGPDLRSRGG